MHHCSDTAHIHDDELVTCYKDVSERYCVCIGNSSTHSKVEGSWIWFYCYLVYATLTCISIMLVIHMRMRITRIGSKVTSCQCTWRIHQPQDVSSVVVRSQDFRDWSTKSPATVKLPKLVARQWLPCMLSARCDT